MRKIKARNIRTLVILLVLLTVAVGYVSHVGLGNACSTGIGLIASICPLGALTSMVAAKTVIPRALIALGVALVLIAIFGRVFCAWICPTPLIQRWFPGYKAKARELENEARSVSDKAGMVEGIKPSEPKEETDDKQAGAAIGCTSCATCATASTGACGTKKMKIDSRHIILGGSLLSAGLFGFPVFCLICPVGLTFATLLLVMRLFAFGETTWTLIVFPLILVLELVVFRKWCHKICPLGALISLTSGLNKTFRPHIDDEKCLVTSKGVACTVCAKACHEGINLRHQELSEKGMNECSKCRDCADLCPAHAISFPLLPPKEGK